MPRPLKPGLEYFPLDVTIENDDKFQMLEALHGLQGFAIVIKLLIKIYASGYYYMFTERELLLTVKRINVTINDVNDVLKDCLRFGIFDAKKYEKYSILTSKGIQERYFYATRRREKVYINKDYIIPGVSVNDNAVNVNDNSKNVNHSTQSKGKERKEKEIYTRVIEYLNQKTGKSFKPDSKKTKSLIKARLNENYQYEDFAKVIDNKSAKWLTDEKMIDFLRPETLFSNKFESYLNEVPKVNQIKKDFRNYDSETINENIPNWFIELPEGGEFMINGKNYQKISTTQIQGENGVIPAIKLKDVPERKVKFL